MNSDVPAGWFMNANHDNQQQERTFSRRRATRAWKGNIHWNLLVERAAAVEVAGPDMMGDG